MKRSKTTKIIWGMVGVLFAVLVGVYAYITYYYSDKFIVNTSISNIDVSNMTLSQAEDIFDAKTNEYSIRLDFRDEKSETINAENIEFRFNSNDGIRSSLEEQNAFAWPVVMVNGAEYEIESAFSEEMLENEINGLEEFDKEKMIKPVDAHIDWSADKGFYIVPEVIGNTLKKNLAVDTIKNAIRNTEEELDLESAYKNPSIYADDENLGKQIDNLKSILPTTVTYTLPSGKEVELLGDTMLKWLDRDENGNYYKNDTKWTESIAAYVEELATKVDTVYKERSFRTTAGTDVTLRGTGYYGWKIWQEKEAEQLKADLESGSNVKREPVYVMKEAASPDDNGGFGNSYIEINLGSQHLWVYQKGKVVFETDVVSGKNVPDRRTPDGSFMTYDKQRNKVLKGDRRPNGTYGYETPVSYWIRLTNTGVGLHDASWRHGRFGGSIWQTSGSHGCINLPPEAAKTIYEIVPENTPVAVYY
ncbi:MAG: L,D-transpeptidase/peptidoglycan binding protein [Lachnospiraceae bacterium]|nr:L,D-transpeptidase/peptidoglycan binding protein [Lachnospiraceae bacterium]